MNEIVVFNSHEFGSIRTAKMEGKPVFCLSDVCRALDIANPSNVRSRLNPDGLHTMEVIDSIGRRQKMLFVSEGNLYRAIFQSKKPNAEKFTDWVADEVIPAIRETGSYSINKIVRSYEIDDPIERAKRWIEEQEELRRENQALSDKVIELEPKGKYFDAVCDANLLTNFRDAAKELGMSQSQFIGWLKREKYIYSTSKGELRPLEMYRASDLFRMKSYVNPNSGFSGVRTYLTPKGIQTFKLLLEAQCIIPSALPKHGGKKKDNCIR